MMLKIITTNPPTNNGAILKLEANIGKSLPTPYRAFLLSHNGGTPEPDTIDIDAAPIKATDIQVFHGIDDEIPSCDLLSCWETLDGCKENQILPIAHDSFGHSFGLILNEADYGQIYYFDSAEAPPRPYLVANDFNEFLTKLRAYTPEELAEVDATSAESETIEPAENA